MKTKQKEIRDFMYFLLILLGIIGFIPQAQHAIAYICAPWLAGIIIFIIFIIAAIRARIVRKSYSKN